MIGFYIHIASIASLMAASLIGRAMINKKTDRAFISKVSQFVLGVLNLVIFGGYFIVFFFPGLNSVEKAMDLSSINIPFVLRIIIGALLVSAGIVVYYITVDMLIKKGKGFSAYKFTEKVVEDSIYKYVRHPMSMGYYLFALGFPFLFDSLYLLVITIFGFVPVQLFYVLVYEEKELDKRFGDSYKEYRKRVSPFMPRLINRRKDEKNGRIGI